MICQDSWCSFLKEVSESRIPFFRVLKACNRLNSCKDTYRGTPPKLSNPSRIYPSQTGIRAPHFHCELGANLPNSGCLAARIRSAKSLFLQQQHIHDFLKQRQRPASAPNGWQACFRSSTTKQFDHGTASCVGNSPSCERPFPFHSGAKPWPILAFWAPEHRPNPNDPGSE